MTSKSGHPDGEFGSSQATAEQFRTLTGLDKDTPTHVDNDEETHTVDRYAEPEGGFGNGEVDPDVSSDAHGELPFAVQRELGDGDDLVDVDMAEPGEPEGDDPEDEE